MIKVNDNISFLNERNVYTDLKFRLEVLLATDESLSLSAGVQSLGDRGKVASELKKR